MSKGVCALLMLLGVSGPAWSQPRGENVGTGSPNHFGQLFNIDDRGGPETRGRDGPRPCLVRIKTGRTECRTMDEWRRLAKQIGESHGRAQD